ALHNQVVLRTRDLARRPRHCVAVAVEAPQDGDGVVWFTPPAVWVRDGADLVKVLPTHPGNQVEKRHPPLEQDATLPTVLTPHRRHIKARGALEGNSGEPSEPPGAHDLARPPDSCIEADLVSDAQEDASGAAGIDHLARLRDGHGERLLAQHGLVPARGG